LNSYSLLRVFFSRILLTIALTDDWGRAPNFLLVDYYENGNVPGSVFEVAANYNGVKYSAKCCGMSTSAASVQLPFSARHLVPSLLFVLFAMAF
jgi:hypothetical protein